MRQHLTILNNLGGEGLLQTSLVLRVWIFLGRNKMELLQSQAPVDQEFSGSSASARHGTFDIGH